MFSAVFKVLALAAVALAIPATTMTDTTVAGDADIRPEVSNIGAVDLCVGNDAANCHPAPADTNVCASFDTEELASFDREVTGIQVPHGHVCVLHRTLGCTSGPNNFAVVTGPGFVNLITTRVHNGFGIPIFFDRQARSMVCNPLFNSPGK